MDAPTWAENYNNLVKGIEEHLEAIERERTQIKTKLDRLLSMEMQDRPLTVAQVAERLGVSEGTVFRLMRRREMPAVRVGKRTVIYEFHLNAYIRSNMEKGA